MTWGCVGRNAGYPLLDDLLAVLYAHPQVHVDVGVIVYTQPRAAFCRFLQGIVEAGFGNRVMFGSEQMVWPGVIERAIAVIEDAAFVSEPQKRDILYNNAARFLRLSAEEIADRSLDHAAAGAAGKEVDPRGQPRADSLSPPSAHCTSAHAAPCLPGYKFGEEPFCAARG